MKTEDLERNYRSSMPAQSNGDNHELLKNINSGLMPTLSKALSEVAGFETKANAAIDQINKKIDEYQEARVGNITVQVDETKTVKGIAKSITQANEAMLGELKESTLALQRVVVELARKKPDSAPVVVDGERPKHWEFDVTRTEDGYKIIADAG